MKTSRIKTLIATSVAVIIGGFAFASDDMKTIMENIRVQQQAVNADLIRVNQQQAKVKTLGEQCREHHGKSASIHKEYMNAMADLRNGRKQLKIDDRNLMEAHEAHIKAHVDEARAEEKVLMRAQYNLDRDKVRGRAIALTEADQLMNARAELRNRFTALERARLGRDKDRWVINREYLDMGAKSSLQLSMGTESNNSRAEK